MGKSLEKISYTCEKNLRKKIFKIFKKSQNLKKISFNLKKIFKSLTNLKFLEKSQILRKISKALKNIKTLKNIVNFFFEKA